MNRRTALLMTMLLGGLAAPKRLWAQSRGRVAAAPARRGEDAYDAPLDDLEFDDSGPPADLPEEPGQQWRQIDISPYTRLPHTQDKPQTAIVEWVFRRTGSATWHSDRVAVLCANRSQLKVYHTPKVIQQVNEMVERFVSAHADVLSVRVRFVAASDPRWRYAVNSRLNLVETGPQGQQIWALRLEDAALAFSQMQVYQGFKLLADQKVEMINGQTLTIETTDTRNYVAALQRENAAGLGLQPGVQPLKEGIVLRFSPLLTYEGNAVEAAVDLKANTVKYLHRTKVIVPREIGPTEMSIDVPEVAESRLNRTIPAWPLGQTLLISAGIHPGILQSKSGLFNLRIPGTVPTSTELLVFIDVDLGGTPPRASRDRDQYDR